MITYKEEKILNAEGEEILNSFKELKKAKSDTLSNLVIESLEKKHKLSLKNVFKKNVDDVEKFLLSDPKTVEKDCSKSILNFARKYLNTDLNFTLTASKFFLNINKKIGLNKTLFNNLYPVEDDLYMKLKNDNFIKYYVHLEIKRFVETLISKEICLKPFKVNVSDVYVNLNYFDFDLNITIKKEQLNDEHLKILSSFLEYLEKELKLKYGL